MASMNPILMTGVSIVFMALSAYTVAFVAQLRSHSPRRLLRISLTVGVGLDLTATSFMIAGSRNFHLTFHGLWGYSALALMALDMVLVWRRYRASPADAIPLGLRRYSVFAYAWWVLAFFAGIFVALRLR